MKVLNVCKSDLRTRFVHLISSLSKHSAIPSGLLLRFQGLRAFNPAASSSRFFLLALLGGCAALALSGCGTTLADPAASSAGVLVVSAKSVNFGNVLLGHTVGDTISLTNPGSLPIEVTQIQLVGSPFSVTGRNNLPIRINAGGTYNLTVSFHPISAGTMTGAVTLTSNTAKNNQVRIALAGNGALVASSAGLTLSETNLTFGDVTTNSTATQTVVLTSSGSAPLSISASSITGSGFSLSGLNTPLTLNPGRSLTITVGFTPPALGAATGQITLTTNTAAGSAAIALSGTGADAASLQIGLRSLSCSSAAVTAVGADSCSVALTGAAGSGGVLIALSSSSSNVAVPASVTIAAGATTAPFTATIASVSTPYTAVLKATAGGVTRSFSIAIGAAAPGITLQSTGVNFGSVALNSPATQTVLLTSSGTAPLSITAIAATGTGFKVSGLTFPLVLDPGQTAALEVQFDPTALGSATGVVTITSNAGSPTISLSGLGVASIAYQVDLNWGAPGTSADPAVGYDIYRARSGDLSFQLVNPSVTTATSYADTTVTNGSTYIYYVVSVDAAGQESAPSQTYTAVIP